MRRVGGWLVLAMALAGAARADESPARKQWHEYCEMSIHVNVDGWYVDKSERDVTIPVSAGSLKCQRAVWKDFNGKTWTSATAYLGAEAIQPLMMLKSLGGGSSTVFRQQGIVDEATACAPVAALLAAAKANGGQLTAHLSRELVRQDWISSKNTDVRLIEQLALKVGSSPAVWFHVAGNAFARGKYCSRQPE